MNFPLPFVRAAGACAFAAALGSAVLCSPVSPAWAQADKLTVENAWARATPPGAPVGGAYFTVRNGGAADKLVGGASPAAARVELHIMSMQDNVMRMRRVESIDVPAGQAVELRPGGLHLMLIDLKAPLNAGDTVPLTLRFENAGEVEVRIPVQAMGASGPGDGHGRDTADGHGHGATGGSGPGAAGGHGQDAAVGQGLQGGGPRMQGSMQGGGLLGGGHATPSGSGLGSDQGGGSGLKMPSGQR